MLLLGNHFLHGLVQIAAEYARAHYFYGIEMKTSAHFKTARTSRISTYKNSLMKGHVRFYAILKIGFVLEVTSDRASTKKIFGAVTQNKIVKD